MDRREFIKHIGAATVASSVVLSACQSNDNETPIAKNVIDGQGEMTYRTNPNTGDRVSLLGYGMMRLPLDGQGPDAPIDQELVNKEIDFALEHGVNYIDTSPAYFPWKKAALCATTPTHQSTKNLSIKRLTTPLSMA